MDPHPQLGVLGKDFPVKPLKRISPSRFMGMQQCVLRELWIASGNSSLLRRSPRARLGTIIHELLEKAGRGDFCGSSEIEITASWERLLSVAEEAMSHNWLEASNVPLVNSIRDLEVQKIRTITKCKEMSQWKQLPYPSDWRAEFEVWLESTDKLIGGFVDCILIGTTGTVLKDFKSGLINVSPGDDVHVKPEYVAQLQLYAGLFAECRGEWPIRLDLVPVTGPVVSVSPDKAQSREMMRLARESLVRVNAIVRSSSCLKDISPVLANPSAANCSYCGYRPICTSYKESVGSIPDEGWPIDAIGELSRVEEFQNGTLALSVSTNNKTARIRGIEKNSKLHPALDSLRSGRSVGVYGLRAIRGSRELTQGSYTTIYLE